MQMSLETISCFYVTTKTQEKLDLNNDLQSVTLNI